jgi:hypothetical protein
MKPKREIKGKEFIGDLRSGLNPKELMEKYTLSADGLRKILKIILDASAMRRSEIESLPNLFEGLNGQDGIRRFPRKRVPASTVVYDGIDQVEAGHVVDVSPQGMRIRGLRIKQGEERTFIVRTNVGGRARSFVFEGICRWADSTDRDTKKWTAGMEISRITDLDAETLTNFVLE